MATIRRGYTLQFAQRPPWFHGVLTTTVRSEDAQVLRAEVMNLLVKGAISFLQPRVNQVSTAATSLSQKRRWPATYSRSQTPESRPGHSG